MLAYQKEALRKITELLKRKYPDRIALVTAFGSRVRGDHTAWSDLDLLVVVNNKTPTLEAEILSILVHEELGGGVSFAPVLKDSKAFELEKLYHTPFYENIVAEGVAL
jgi:predicted nucleotidyltransferase